MNQALKQHPIKKAQQTRSLLSSKMLWKGHIINNTVVQYCIVWRQDTKENNSISKVSNMLKAQFMFVRFILSTMLIVCIKTPNQQHGHQILYENSLAKWTAHGDVSYFIITLTLQGLSAGVSGSLDSYCSLKPLCSGRGEVVPARTSPTLLPPSPCTVLSLSCFKSVAVHQLS